MAGKKKLRPIIYDCTLREGFQTPGGIGASLEERVFAANHISRFAHWAEVGMPANPNDYDVIKAIKESYIENGRETGLSVLCTNQKSHIDAGAKVLKGYHTTMAHLFLGTSEEHRKARKGSIGDKPEDFEKSIYKHVKYAATKHFSKIMFSLEDSFRTFEQDEKLFFKFVDAAIKGYDEGNSKKNRESKLVMNFPDTVGKSSISEFNEMLGKIKKRYGCKIEVSVHGHNDRSASDQQALEVYKAGLGNWIQTTFGRLGERNGIASTEVIVPMFEERGYLKGDKIIEGNNLDDLVPTSKAIVAALGKTIPDEQQVSGYKTQVSTSGIHAAAAMKDKKTYHIAAGKYGANPVLEFGSTSGANQVTDVIKEIGLNWEKSNPKIIDFVNVLKGNCNRYKRAYHDSDIKYKAIKRFKRVNNPLVIDDYNIITPKRGKEIIKIKGSYNGKRFRKKVESKGTVEGLIKVLNQITGEKIELENFFTNVRPKIPKGYLTWKKGEYPQIPKGLNQSSEFVQLVAIKNGHTEGSNIYWGYASGENTFRTIANAVIDSVVKMCTIKEYHKRNPVENPLAA